MKASHVEYSLKKNIYICMYAFLFYIVFWKKKTMLAAFDSYNKKKWRCTDVQSQKNISL